LERILDPGVRASIEARLTGSSKPVVVLDAIRLIEGGLYQRCDAVWVVVCDSAVQIARLQATRNFSEEQAVLRVNAQLPVEEKLKHATFVIHNDGSLQEMEVQVANGWRTSIAPYLVQSSPP
jgi:dephospho-CoA kinase